MSIAIVSDIHDHVWNLERALPSLQASEAVLCCGDLCSPFVLAQLASAVQAPIHVVFGNNDGDEFRLTRIAEGFDHVTLHGSYFRGAVAGLRVAMSHYPEIARALDPEGLDLVAYGHDHRFHVGRLGSAWLVNPGPLMGFDPAERSDVPPTFVLFDPEDRGARGFRLAGDGRVEPHQAPAP